MGDWDDDDEWDVGDVEAKLAEKEKETEKQRRRDDGLDSESEEEQVQVQAPVAKSAPKKKKEKKGAAQADPEEGLTEDQRKLRLRRLQEEQEEQMGMDMFAGCTVERDGKKSVASSGGAKQQSAEKEPAVVVVDAFDKLELKLQAEVESLCNTCVTKLDKSKVKGVNLKFLCDLVKVLESEIDLKDLELLEKAVTGYAKDKKAATGAVDMKNNKANTKINKNTKFDTRSEYSCIYGGDGDDEEWTQEEWDDWAKKDAAANAKWEADEAAKKGKTNAATQKQQQEWEASQQEVIEEKIQKENSKAKAKAEPEAASADSDPLPVQAAPKAKNKAKK